MAAKLPIRAFLISATGGLKGDAVYAVLHVSEDEALAAAARELDLEASQVTIAGGISRDMVRALKLKAGDVRKA